MRRDYYEFLRTEVRPRLNACEINLPWLDADKKREVLVLLGAKTIYVRNVDGEDESVPIEECSDFQIDRAASQAQFAMRKYLRNFPFWEEEQKAKDRKARQLLLPFKDSIRVGGPEYLLENMTREQMRGIHARSVKRK